MEVVGGSGSAFDLRLDLGPLMPRAIAVAVDTGADSCDRLAWLGFFLLGVLLLLVVFLLPLEAALLALGLGPFALPLSFGLGPLSPGVFAGDGVEKSRALGSRLLRRGGWPLIGGHHASLGCNGKTGSVGYKASVSAY